jgi:hypothetical protein
MIVKRLVCLLKAFDRRLDGYSVIRVQRRADQLVTRNKINHNNTHPRCQLAETA